LYRIGFVEPCTPCSRWWQVGAAGAEPPHPIRIFGSSLLLHKKHAGDLALSQGATPGAVGVGGGTTGAGLWAAGSHPTGIRAPLSTPGGAPDRLPDDLREDWNDKKALNAGPRACAPLSAPVGHIDTPSASNVPVVVALPPGLAGPAAEPKAAPAAPAAGAPAAAGAKAAPDAPHAAPADAGPPPG